MTVRALAALAVVMCGCGGAPQANPGPAPVTQPSVEATTTPAPATTVDTAALVPAGLGSLKQEDISIKLQPSGVAVRLIPLDESVIRVLSPDSYRALHDLAASRRGEIDRLARAHGLRERNLWYATFMGLAPDARFVATDLTITSGGREYRPVEVVALTAGFGAQRLQVRETQTALYLMEDGIDLAQPLVVRMGSERNRAWEDILRLIERERAAIRSRRGG